MEQPYPRNPILVEIANTLISLSKTKYIEFLWVPGHSGIRGNELADKAAKEALNLNITPTDRITADIKQHVQNLAYSEWQNTWNQSNSTMKNYKHTTQRISSNLKIRKDQVVMSRLRMRHTRATNGHHMENADESWCDEFNTKVTVEHILFECQLYARNRLKYNLKKSHLEPTATFEQAMKIINYLKEIKLYDQI